MAESLKFKLTPARKKHLQNIAALGGNAKYKKYGHVSLDEQKRKRAWEKWWEGEGKLKSQKILQPVKIKKPNRSRELAEFVGIMIGDGGISEYFIAVTLNSNTDAKYAVFVSKLIEKLFKVTPKVRRRKISTALDVIVHRKELVDFCIAIGLKKGNKLKQNLDIPDWIKKESVFSRACLRGLIDTDGSFYEHHYMSKGKMYHYEKVSFSSRSPLLIRSVYLLLQDFCIKSEIAYNGKEVRIQSQENVKKFVKLIGTSNPKHADKHRQFNLKER